MLEFGAFYAWPAVIWEQRNIALRLGLALLFGFIWAYVNMSLRVGQPYYLGAPSLM